MSAETMTARQSDLIRAMRFPLIVLVVFCHAPLFAPADLEPALTGEYAFHFLTTMLSQILGNMSVCWFFVFSGYFFFHSLDQQNLWGRERGIPYKWKKRLRTLLVPYLIWNLLVVAITLILSFLYAKAGLNGDNLGMEAVHEGPVYWLFSGPADFPLWYLRDLIILCVLAPAFFYLFKVLGKLTPVLLVLTYLSPLEPGIPAMRAICFFGTGAWLGMNHMDMLEICRKMKPASYVLAAILLLLATCFDRGTCHEPLVRLFYPFGMISLMNICDAAIDHQRTKDWLLRMSRYVFFIYAAHEVFILGWTKGLLVRMLGLGIPAQLVSYFLTPAIVIGVCILLYKILEKITPRTLTVLCGDRATHSGLSTTTNYRS